MQYVLYLTTDKNLLYKIEFSPTFLRNHENIYVNQGVPIQIQNYDHQFILNRFGVYFDKDTDSMVYAYGLGVSPEIDSSI